MNIRDNLRQAIREEKTLELESIFEESTNIKPLIETNLIYLLKRENLITEKYVVIIPQDYLLEIEDGRFHFSGRFNLYYKDTVTASGSILGEGEVNKDKFLLASISTNIMEVNKYGKSQGSLKFF